MITSFEINNLQEPITCENINYMLDELFGKDRKADGEFKRVRL
jgi:hypothetical protein